MMQKFFVTLAAVALFFASPAYAQLLVNPNDASAMPQGLTSQAQAPRATSDLQVAMLFYKLIDKQPKFQAWAAASQAYEQAGMLNKEWVLESQTKALKDTFSVYTKSEPIIAKMAVVLSPYDTAKKQFTVVNIRPSTFFPYAYAQRKYAVVPLGLETVRYIQTDGSEAGTIDQAANSNGYRKVTLYLYIRPIVPIRAGEYPVQLAGAIYYLISGNVLNAALYDKGKLLWEENPGVAWKENTGTAHEEDQRNLLLNLKTQ